MSDHLRDLVLGSLADGLRVRQALIDGHLDAILRSAAVVRDAIKAGHKILLCGNGGSAADAQHIAAELVGRFVIERRGLPAIALTTDSSALTALANDYGYAAVFARQVDALGAPGDVLVAITTSGKSPNVIAAIESARARGMKVVALTGLQGAALVEACDGGVAVPSTNTARIQECHITIGHLLCELVDAEFVVPVRAGAPQRIAKEHTLDELVALRETWRQQRRTVVWTNGVFDLLHVGHLHSLREARRHGDVLVVGVNSDASVRGNKGPDRPIFPAGERVEMLAALDLVDAITVFEDPTPERILTALRPDVHVKGADYAPPNGKPIPEAEVVKAYGGRIEFVRLVPDRSSTSTLDKLLAARTGAG
jgi:phosphoheptose isomerase